MHADVASDEAAGGHAGMAPIRHQPFWHGACRTSHALANRELPTPSPKDIDGPTGPLHRQSDPCFGCSMPCAPGWSQSASG